MTPNFSDDSIVITGCTPSQIELFSNVSICPNIFSDNSNIFRTTWKLVFEPKLLFKASETLSTVKTYFHVVRKYLGKIFGHIKTLLITPIWVDFDSATVVQSSDEFKWWETVYHIYLCWQWRSIKQLETIPRPEYSLDQFVCNIYNCNNNTLSLMYTETSIIPQHLHIIACNIHNHQPLASQIDTFLDTCHCHKHRNALYRFQFWNI